MLLHYQMRQAMQNEAGLGIEAHNRYGANRWVGGTATHSDETVAEEVPVALVYNGISHAVMLATPQDLEDFALGFSLSECIVGRSGEIQDMEIFERGNGIEVHMQLSAQRAHALEVLGEALQHVAELTTGLTRANHVDIKVAKLLRVLGQNPA